MKVIFTAVTLEIRIFSDIVENTEIVDVAKEGKGIGGDVTALRRY